MLTAAYGAALLLQLAAAAIAFLQVRHAPRKLPWLLVALSSLCIVARYSMKLIAVMNGTATLPPEEVFTLFSAAFFFFGVLYMGRLFEAVADHEKLLQSSEEKYRTVADFTYDWEMWHDPQGKLLYCSPSCGRITGFSHDEFINNPGLLMDIVHPDDQAAVAAHLHDDHANTNNIFRLDFRILTRSGEERWISHACSPVNAPDGRYLGRRVSNRDITTRKRTQHELEHTLLVLNAINSLSQESLKPETTPRELAARCLAMVEQMTQSRFGFINELNSQGRYDCIALTDPGWRACRMPESRQLILPQNLEIRGFGGRVVKENRPLIVNDPEHHPDRIPLPEGHPEIRCFLGVPLQYYNTMFGLIAVANKDGGYTPDDALAVQQIAAAFVMAYQQIRNREWASISENRLESLLALANMNVPVRESADFVLEKTVQLTLSTVGFLGFISDDESTMIIHAWSKTAMQDCAVTEAPIHYPIAQAGSWGEAIRQRRPVIVNAYAEPHSGKKGLPEGHVNILRFAVVPHLVAERVVAVIAVANKQTDYDDADIRQMRLLLDGLWKHASRTRERDRLEQSLSEKELLLREIHHRVKNNLSIVASMLDLQAGVSPDRKIEQAFQESKARIASIALIHTLLYQSDNFSRVDMDSYTRQLCAMLQASFVPHRENIRVAVEAAGVSLDIDQAIPCGLVINELFTNSVKYAFPDEKPGSIVVRFSLKEGTCMITASDDGVGLPLDIDIARSKTLGLQLVHLLVQQLEGTIAVERDGGTKYRIEFKI